MKRFLIIAGIVVVIFAASICVAYQQAQSGLRHLEIRARHILIKADHGDILQEQQALEKITEVHERILAGESFAKLAKEFSDDTSSAIVGGDLGYQEPKEFDGEFREALDDIFRADAAAGKPAVASNVRGGSPVFAAAATVDGDPSTYWAADDSVRRAFLEFDLGVEVAFNLVRIQEPIRLGQRISEYRIEAKLGEGWQTLFVGTTIGYKKLDRVETTRARYVRLVILGSRGPPLISEVGIHIDPRR